MMQMYGEDGRRKENNEHLNVGLFLGVLNKYPVVPTGEEHVHPAAAVNIQRHAAAANTTIKATTPALNCPPAVAVNSQAAASDAHLLQLSVHLILFSFIRNTKLFSLLHFRDTACSILNIKSTPKNGSCKSPSSAQRGPSRHEFSSFRY
jgi:hypothetical protein